MRDASFEGRPVNGGDPTFRPALLDGNVLVALIVADHVHHGPARKWFGLRGDRPFLTCPITQGTLLRVSLHHGAMVDEATEALAALSRHPHHRFVPDTLSYLEAEMRGVIGHRQVTDAYLVAIAEREDAVVATFDAGLASLRPERSELVSTESPRSGVKV